MYRTGTAEPEISSSGSRDPARRRGVWRRAVAVAGAVVMVAGLLSVSASTASAAEQQAYASHSTDSAAKTTRDYVIRYWPRWISYGQQTGFAVASGRNTLAGPEIPMGPQFRLINAINDDTIYASSLYLDLRQGPVILTLPPTRTIFSILPLDVFGETFDSGIASQASGKYALTLAGWQGTLPAGVTRLIVPQPVTIWIFRADKYSPTNEDMTAEAAKFRTELRLAPLAAYQANPDTGAPTIAPLFPAFATSFKLAQDIAANRTPQLFLRLMQRAVHDPATTPMYPSDLRLSAKFDQVFAAAQQAQRRGNPRPMRTIERAVRDAYDAIVARWMNNTGRTNWIHFDNIAAWGTAYLDRAATTEYLQFGNNISAANYWSAYVDRRGRPLNGALHDYKLTFTADQIPDAKRFWSLTAYTPRTIELIPNRANKYLVARYTPGLVYDRDGSVTIYMSVRKPASVPAANWLPVRRGLFNVYLRAYGPEGNTAPDAGYIPPAVTVAR